MINTYKRASELNKKPVKSNSSFQSWIFSILKFLYPKCFLLIQFSFSVTSKDGKWDVFKAPFAALLELQMLRLGSPLCLWIKNFLMNRPQHVRMDTSTSSTIILKAGVPQ